MMKITMLALVLAAVALSGAVSVASAETVPSPLQQVRDGVPIGEVVCFEDRVLMVSQTGMPACVFEESVLELETRGFGFVGEPFDMFPIKSTDNHGPPSAPRIGIPPVVSMSRLPNIGETAVVEITFTNNLAINITDIMNEDLHSTGWRISSAFEIVDSGGLQYEIENMGEDNPTMAQYTAFTPLDSGESITYRIEVRAVSEGHAFVAGVGYSHSGESIRLYLDSEETLLYEDHWAKYPEMHQRSASPRHDGQPPENTEKIYIPYADPTRDEFWEWFVSHHTHANPRITPIDALNFVYRAGVHLNLTATDVRQLLSDGGYADAEIDDALSQHLSTQSSARFHEPTPTSFPIYGWLRNTQIPTAVGSTTYVNSANVCLYIDNISAHSITELDCLYSGSDGTFHIDADSAHVPAGDIVELRAVISSDGEHAAVRDVNDRPYYAARTLSNISVSTIFMNIEIDSRYGNLQNALWIVDSISDAHDHFSTNYGITPSKSTVYWQSGLSPNVFPGNWNLLGTFYGFNNTIYLDGIDEMNFFPDPIDEDDSNNRFVILHEYAHQIMDNRTYE